MTLFRAARNPWLLATGANVAIGLLGMATAGLVARLLGPADRGVLAAAVLWSGMIFAALGLPGIQAVVFQWSRGDSAVRRRGVAGSALALIVISSSLCIPLAFVVNYRVLGGYGNPQAFTAANVFLFSQPLSLVAGAIGAAFLASGNGLTFWGLRVISAAVYFFAIVGVGALGWGSVLSCAAAAAVGIAAAGLWGVVRFWQQSWGAPRWESAAFRAMTVFGLKANGVGVPTQVNLRAAQALMTLLVPAAVLGQYAVASTWSYIVMLLGGGLSSVLLARSAAAGDSADRMAALFAQFRRVVLTVTVLGVVAAAGAPLGVPLLFGPAFAPAVLPAVLLCVGSVVFTLTLSLHEIARGLGHPGVGIPAEVSSLGVGVLLLVLLLRPFGGTGAAVASIVSYATALVVLAVRLDRRLEGRLLPALLPSVRDAVSLAEAVGGVLWPGVAGRGRGAR